MECPRVAQKGAQVAGWHRLEGVPPTSDGYWHSFRQCAPRNLAAIRGDLAYTLKSLEAKMEIRDDICEAIITSAHKHGVRVVAHIYYLEDAKRLTDFGIDGLAHIVRDKPVDQELIDSMKRHNTWQVASTLTREVSLFVRKNSGFYFRPLLYARRLPGSDQDSQQP